MAKPLNFLFQLTRYLWILSCQSWSRGFFLVQQLFRPCRRALTLVPDASISSFVVFLGFCWTFQTKVRSPLRICSSFWENAVSDITIFLYFAYNCLNRRSWYFQLFGLFSAEFLGFASFYQGQKGTGSKGRPLNTATKELPMNNYDNWPIRSF